MEKEDLELKLKKEEENVVAEAASKRVSLGSY
jgi:hypothetical protein